jgi:hypothetical protein
LHIFVNTEELYLGVKSTPTSHKEGREKLVAGF